MKLSAIFVSSLLALTLPAAAQIQRHPATKEDARPNDPKVPDSYVLSGRFDKILVLRAKNKTDLLTEMEKQVKAQNIKNAVILSGIGSVRGYRLHNVAGRDYPVPDMFFSAPNTPADFIGMNNLFKGEVAANDGTVLTIEGSLGAFTVPATHAVPLGSPASFVVAADRINMTSAEAGASPGLPTVKGTVIGMEFVGSTQTVFVEVAGSGEMRVQKQQHEIEALGLVPGRRINLEWDPRHAWLLPEAA